MIATLVPNKRYLERDQDGKKERDFIGNFLETKSSLFWR